MEESEVEKIRREGRPPHAGEDCLAIRSEEIKNDWLWRSPQVAKRRTDVLIAEDQTTEPLSDVEEYQDPRADPPEVEGRRS